MGAPYRMLQSDFSAGQIDRMTEANLNLPYKQIGLRESFNTIHNANRTVSKRPGTILKEDFFKRLMGSGTSYSAILTLPSGNSISVFGSSIGLAVFSQGGTKLTEFQNMQRDWNLMPPYSLAVYNNFLFIAGENIPLVTVIEFYEYTSGGETDIGFRNRSFDYDTWNNMPSCVEDEDTTFDSLMIAGGRLFLSKGVKYFYSRIRVAGLLEEDSSGFPTWMMDFSLNDTLNIQKFWVSNNVKYNHASCEAGDEVVPKSGIIYTDAESGQKYIWDGSDYVETEEDGNVYVDSSYGFEGMDNDMSSSKILWMAYLGRVIMATEEGLFMSTSQGIDPTTFDMTQASSYGSCGVEPMIVANILFFMSSDRKKIYGAYFSSDYQGLVVVDTTANSREFFSGTIKSLFAYDYPELSIFAISPNGKLFYCQPTISESSFLFAWSEWEIGPSSFAHRLLKIKTETAPFYKICILTDGPEVLNLDTLALLEINYNDPYADDSSVPMLDFQITEDEFTVADGALSFAPSYYYEDKPMTLFIRPADDLTRAPYVVRNVQANETVKIPSYLEGFYDGNGDLKALSVTYGYEYISRFTLFQQVLPNNSGIALSSKHNLKDVSAMLFRSFGGYLEVAGRKVADLPYLTYGQDAYSATVYDFTKSGPYSYTGVLKLTNPRYIGQYDADNRARDVVEDDRVAIVHDRPFPFNLMAVSLGYIITEVN